ncbi:MAG: hypothetical protein ABIS14_16145 [Sphingomonas sp.]
MKALRRKWRHGFADGRFGAKSAVDSPVHCTATTLEVSDGYLRLLGDWAKGKLNPPYGRAEKISIAGTARPAQRAH